MDDLSHLTNHEEATSVDKIDRITELAELYRKRKIAVDATADKAKEAKKAFNQVSMEALPEAMAMAGVKEIELIDGAMVSYKEEANVTVKDIEKLKAFLVHRGDDALLKCSLEFGKLPENIVNKIMSVLDDKFGLTPEIKVFVHPATLKSYFNTMLGLKKKSVAETSMADLNQDAIGVSLFTMSKSTVKEPKIIIHNKEK